MRPALTLHQLFSCVDRGGAYHRITSKSGWRSHERDNHTIIKPTECSSKPTECSSPRTAGIKIGQSVFRDWDSCSLLCGISRSLEFSWRRLLWLGFLGLGLYWSCPVHRVTRPEAKHDRMVGFGSRHFRLYLGPCECSPIRQRDVRRSRSSIQRSALV